MCFRRVLAWLIKKSTPGRIADFILLCGWLAVLICNCITLLTQGIIPLSTTAVSKIGECTLFIRVEENEQNQFDTYGSHICIFTIVAPSLICATTLGFILYHAIKICLGSNLSCVEIIIAILSGLILVFALSNACIITFGFITSCLSLNLETASEAQDCGSGIWAAITQDSTYDVFNTLNAAQTSSWCTVIILLILTVLFIIRATVYYQRKKYGSGLVADATNVVGMV